MKKIIILISAISLSLTSCNKEKQIQNTPIKEKTTEIKYTHKLSWTAYKTPNKVGVKGTFKNIKLNQTKSTGDIENDLTNATFSIDTSTVKSGDGLRDSRLANGFFKLMLDGTISGKFISFTNNQAIVEIKMNNQTKKITLNKSKAANRISLNGKIDLLKDFSANKAFESISNICKDVHLNKTWSDVDIEVIINKK